MLLFQRKVDGSARSCVVKQLQANTRYLFSVTAASAHHESDHSGEVYVSTSGTSVSCGLHCCKNRPAQFPGRMSQKATKPGSVFLS